MDEGAAHDEKKLVSKETYIECDGGSLAAKNDNGSVSLGAGIDLRTILYLDPQLDGKWVFPPGRRKK